MYSGYGMVGVGGLMPKLGSREAWYCDYYDEIVKRGRENRLLLVRRGRGGLRREMILFHQGQME